jgi:hypothetical protein
VLPCYMLTGRALTCQLFHSVGILLFHSIPERTGLSDASQIASGALYKVKRVSAGSCLTGETIVITETTTGTIFL